MADEKDDTDKLVSRMGAHSEGGSLSNRLTDVPM